MTQKFKVGDRVQVNINGVINRRMDDAGFYKMQTDEGKLLYPHQDTLAPAPALVVVPECVSQFLHLYGDKNRWSLTDLFDYLFTAREPLEKEVYGWIKTKNGNDELFARAWLNGYTVEKEPLYRVPLTDEGRDGLLVALSYDEETDDSYEVVHVLSQVFSEENFYKLTEKQIREYDERYWAFAVPVEEDEG